MRNLYDGDTFEHDGMSFRVNMPYDEWPDAAPWEDEDGHGPVRRITYRYRDAMPKRAGELVLWQDRHETLLYDYQEACRIALKDGWGAKGDEGMTRRQKAAYAARKDFEHLYGYCNDYWSYIGVVVTLLDNDGGPLEDYSASLWRIESNAGDFITEVAHELAAEIIAQVQTTLAA